MKLIITTLFLFATWCALAQGARSFNPQQVNTNKAKSLYNDGKYADAIPLLEDLTRAGNASAELLYYLASSYAYTADYEKATAAYNNLFSTAPDYSSYAYYECGYAYTGLRQFDKAAYYYTQFLDKNPGTPNYQIYIHRAKYRLEFARNLATLNQELTMPVPTRMPAPINTSSSEYLPMLDPTGRKLYFTSTRSGGVSQEEAMEGEFDEDLYYIEKIDGVWGEPVLMPEPINTSRNDGAASFSADGQTMVYGACNREDGVGSCDLYIAYLNGNAWSTPVNMGNVVNSKSWDAQSTISSDGNKIIFASERPGGYGDTDLYMVEKNIFGDWGIPVNLGPMVNTPFGEYTPFLSQDGKTLYFSSYGHSGYGGSDIFKSVFEDGKWSRPVNLGKPINTAGDDRFFTIGGPGEFGYFASDRDGNLDLYEIEIPEHMRPEPTVVVSGTVTDAKSREPIGAYVLVEDISTGELIAVNKSNSATGHYLVVLPAGRKYSVSANKESFFFYSNRFDIPMEARYNEVKMDIELKPIEKGAKVVLNNIFFETGKSTLSPESRLELEKAVALLRQNPSMIIEVGGHTDNVGDDATNMKLSHDRARSVREYLVAGGIPPGRLQAKGYGELNPIASNDTDDGRKANRRTEFVILEF